ncbi:beta-propeller fold lactonase family protein [Methylobacterium nonmethylotrophicum]|uniref:YncE family protein n=1 Tax=Methylobacterium nonmethylotrophicum TaxID=1141884 RepID=A0A4Z0NI78_9HYPH|nr:beta-propeller fold lactonase family protein [Methylobacterium nonmethylotrophicum]TGD96036.1 YncE family protein [Methylobacterium nonmethylotrophicum]
MRGILAPASPHFGRAPGPARRLAAVGCLIAIALAPLPALAAEAFVTAQNADAVDVVDLDALTVVARIPVPGAPAGVALSPDRASVYVTAPEGKALVVIDAAARRVVRTVPLGGGPLGVGVNPVSGAVYVADWYAKRLWEIDPRSLAVAAEIPVGTSPSGIAVTPDGKFLLAADRDDDALSLVDTATRERVATIPVGTRPFGVTIDREGRRAFSANVGSNDVSVVDLGERREVGRVKVGERPYAVALAQGRAFVTDQYGGTVSTFDAATLAPGPRLAVGEYPEGIQAGPDGRTVYVANWESNTLTVIDAGALTVTGTVKTADGPRAFGLFLR